jgi:dihydroorotate dehydrogenase
VRRARALVGDRLAIIASGGIGSGEDAATLIAAGADLVQLWTGLVYDGPGLIGEATKACGAARAG